MRRQVPLVITFVVGAVLIIAAFIPHYPFGRLGENFSLYFDIIAVFAFILGGGNLIRIHGSKFTRGVRMSIAEAKKAGGFWPLTFLIEFPFFAFGGLDDKRGKDWFFSFITLAGFVVMLYVGLFKIGNPDGWSGNVTHPLSTFQQFYNYIFNPLQATMYALLAFFVASASYRAFRAKNPEATILLATAFIILLGRTPAGTYATGWLPESLSFFHVPNLANWVMAVPNLAGQRAILIGIALGVIAMSLRVILGVERTYLGSDHE
ncbi:MAG: hypothetical protein Kow0074_17820 [Candidatus Zixiibacteriota bacterium]